VDIKWNFWKKTAVKINTSAKNVGVWIRKNYFQDSLLDKVAREVIPVPPERVRLEHVDSDRKDLIMKIAGSACIIKENLFYDLLQ